MAKDKTYTLVIGSQTRNPSTGRLSEMTKSQEDVVGARAAAKRATALIRSAKREDVDNRMVQVYDTATRKSVMLCQGPAIYGRKRTRSARQFFAQCVIEQKAFKTALRAKKRR